MSYQEKHNTSLGTVYLIGEQSRISADPRQSYEHALTYGANRGEIAQLIVAGDHTMEGHKCVYGAKFDSPRAWDGAVVSSPRAAVVIQTADCPSLILTHKKTGRAALVHAGRPALTGTCNVINNAVHAVLQGYEGAADLEALVVGAICGSCFKHDREEAKPLIEYFHRLPDYVFADKETGALDLYEVIRHGLMYHGVKDENIRRAGPCTFETTGLSSYRRDRTALRNTVIMVLD